MIELLAKQSGRSFHSPPLMRGCNHYATLMLVIIVPILLGVIIPNRMADQTALFPGVDARADQLPCVHNSGMTLASNPALVKQNESSQGLSDQQSQPPRTHRYLKAESKNVDSMLGSFTSFDQRFMTITEGRIWDRFLKVTWILPHEPKSDRFSLRLDWESAQNLAGNLKARFPMLEELKTLITERYDNRTEAYINAEFFCLNPRTKRCWTNARGGLLEPFHRSYVDFGGPVCGITSMSEIYCTLLIAAEKVEH